MSIPIITTRFNTDTYTENKTFREKNNIGCIYGPSRHMSWKIPSDSLVFVIEMNNSTNKIEGIGLIRNRVRHDKHYRIYESGNYNRYAYSSQFRLDREILQAYEPNIVALLDIIIFKGKTHLKRGCGFTIIPKKLFSHPICNDFDAETYINKTVEMLFKRVYSDHSLSQSASDL